MLNQFLLMCSLLILSIQTQAGIYKWVDEQGNIHYSQHKPKTRPVQTIKGDYRAPEDRSTYKRPTLGSDAKENQGSQTDANVENPEQKEASAQQQTQPVDNKPKIKPKQKKAACESARRNLATMQSRGQIRRRDKDGNVTYMSEKEKQARLKRTRELIKKNCN